MNSDNTEFMPFNQDGAIFELKSKPRKLIDQFIYLGSIISSTETDAKIKLGLLLTDYRQYVNLISQAVDSGQNVNIDFFKNKK